MIPVISREVVAFAKVGGNKLGTYENYVAAAKSWHLDKDKVRQQCCMKILPLEAVVFRFADDYNPKSEFRHNQCRPLVVIHGNGDVENIVNLYSLRKPDGSEYSKDERKRIIDGLSRRGGMLLHLSKLFDGDGRKIRYMKNPKDLGGAEPVREPSHECTIEECPERYRCLQTEDARGCATYRLHMKGVLYGD